MFSDRGNQGTSGMIDGLAACFAGLADPRATRRCDHRLIDILVIAVCAVIACAESWEDIELYGRSKRAWLKSFLALPNGIPSHDTSRRVFMPIDPDAFEACFARWAQSLTGKVEREVVAIDGKAVRRSGNRRHDHGPLHLVGAWASDRGLVLGQREVDGESNEITAVPELLDTLHLDGSIVTLDAMGCQKDIAARIRAKVADYLLVLKANHGHAFEAVREHFERTCVGRGSGGRPVFDAFDESHGRLVRRRAFVSSAVRELAALHQCCTNGPISAPCWRWRRSAASTAPARPRSATSLPAAATILPSWSEPSAGTGASRTPCIGFSTSPSARMTAGCATAPQPGTSPFYAESPSTSPPAIAAAEPAFAVGARRPPGTTTTCSGSSPARLMREPWRGDELLNQCDKVQQFCNLPGGLPRPLEMDGSQAQCTGRGDACRIFGDKQRRSKR